MIAKVSPSAIKGEVFAPASKSAMQRACALALLNKGTTIISNPGTSNDDSAAQDIIRRCGAVLTMKDGQLIISSNGKVKPYETIHAGESGLSVRMFTPIVALADSTITLTGEGSLLSRPMTIFEKVLPQLNVFISTNKGFLPMDVRGPMVAQDCSIDGSGSSQYVTGILFALAKAAKKRVCLTVSNLTSRPYVDLSLQMLAHFGYNVQNDAYERFSIEPADELERDVEYTTEGDWSGAAFLLVAATIAGSGVLIKGLDLHSKQADKAILNVLEQCGVTFHEKGDGVFLNRCDNLMPFTFDATHCPDLFPPLTALAVYCNGQSVIHGTSRLITKESNRLEALLDVFTKMGATIRAEADSLIIEGGNAINAAEVDGHHDHRIVMACAIAALAAQDSINIHGCEAINKSYPDFFNHLTMLGAAVSLTDN